MKKMVKSCSDAVKANSFKVNMTRTDKIKVVARISEFIHLNMMMLLIAMLFNYTMISAHLFQ